jgi:hypothetical protein
MSERIRETYLEPSQEAARAFFSTPRAGRVVMLNLLRFRDVADYSGSPELAPASPISGEAAYRMYMEHTMPHLEKSGGSLMFYGRAGGFAPAANLRRVSLITIRRVASAVLEALAR